MNSTIKITQDEFLRAATENLYWAASGDRIIKVTIPGSGTAAVISEQEYDFLLDALDICQKEGLL